MLNRSPFQLLVYPSVLYHPIFMRVDHLGVFQSPWAIPSLTTVYIQYLPIAARIVNHSPKIAEK